MGSAGDTPAVVGQYILPFIDEHTTNDDPWQRNYGQPPKNLSEVLVSRHYPLIDIRHLLPGNSAVDLLKSHGFGVVKHHSPLIDQLNSADAELPEEAIKEQYYPEIEQLVKETLAARRVIIMNSALRQGKRLPEEFKFPTGMGQAKDAVAEDNKKHTNNNQELIKDVEVQKHKLANQSKLNLGAPIRVPHMDFTDQGARASIRHQDQDVFEAAKDIIAYEDKICADQSFDAESHEANFLIGEQYNQRKELGPRYAAYSIWRPLRKIERDPITLGLSGGPLTAHTSEEMVYWPYLNRYKGVPELGGDFLKEFAMLGVNRKEQSDGSKDDAVKWYYVSNQNPDEVLFIKQFDSASLGSKAQHAPAPWHASPEIGSVEGDEPRESIEARVFVFW